MGSLVGETVLAPPRTDEAETPAHETGWPVARPHLRAEHLAILLWVLILLHPLALIALSFRWGLL